MRIYMAGGLFTTAEQNFNTALATALRGLGHEVFLPQESEQDVSDLNKIFRSDVAGIDWSQLVLGNLDGADSDSGTCWELGYGYAKNKHTIVYRTDFRIGKTDIVNLMMTESANVVILAPLMTVPVLAERIHQEIQSRFAKPGLVAGRDHSPEVKEAIRREAYERDTGGPGAV
jgi:nucleoside 2-deoxyribosyltransferase